MIFLFPKVGYVNPLEGMYLQCPALPFHHWDGDPGVGRRSVKRRAPRASAEAPLAWKGFCSEWSRILWRKPDTLKGTIFQPQDRYKRNHQQSWEIMNYTAKVHVISNHIGPYWTSFLHAISRSCGTGLGNGHRGRLKLKNAERRWVLRDAIILLLMLGMISEW